MRKRFRIIIPIFAIIIDLTVIVGSTLLSYFIRFSDPVVGLFPLIDPNNLPQISWYFQYSLLLSSLVISMLLMKHLYKFPSQEGLFDEIVFTIRSFVIAWTIILAATFFYRQVSYSRLIMAILIFVGPALMTIVKVGVRRIRELLILRGFAVRKAAIIGEYAEAQRIHSHLLKHPEFGVQVIGRIYNNRESSNGLDYLGNLEQAGDLVKKENLDTLIIALAGGDEKWALPLLVKSCYGLNVDFLYMPDIQPIASRPRSIVSFGDVPLWTLKENPFEGWHGVAKRTFDIVLSTIFLLICLPLMIVTAILIKLDSKGPIFYHQRRIGLNGIEFDCYKFRSMRTDAEKESGPVWTTQDDPRTTRVGSFIRRWAIDEIPQFWNVFRGDMSLVGPRPERPEFVRKFESQIDGYQERHRVKSGMTGWAQVNGQRGNSPIEIRTKYDRYYVENWSLLYDIKIMLLTVRAVIKGDGAY